ncbi:MAG: molecular chaperone [Pantoea sp. Brub]|nr:molecular chaperone [Pantoea sp. Brub]
MKRVLYILVTVLVLIFCYNIKAATKIAVANIAIIFDESPERTKIAKKLETEFKNRISELQKQEVELNNRIKQFQRDKSTMSATEAKNTDTDILYQKETFTKNVQAFEEENQHRQIEERDKILNNIKKIIQKIAKKENYNLVLDAKDILYISNIKDITEEVLKQVK